MGSLQLLFQRLLWESSHNFSRFTSRDSFRHFSRVSFKIFLYVSWYVSIRDCSRNTFGDSTRDLFQSFSEFSFGFFPEFLERFPLGILPVFLYYFEFPKGISPAIQGFCHGFLLIFFFDKSVLISPKILALIPPGIQEYIAAFYQRFSYWSGRKIPPSLIFLRLSLEVLSEIHSGIVSRILSRIPLGIFHLHLFLYCFLL